MNVNGKYHLKKGDEQLDWATYGDLWRTEQVTRGALDVLVLNGKVPWCTGAELLGFLEREAPQVLEAAQRLGANCPYKTEETYYSMTDFLLAYKAGEAAVRLIGISDEERYDEDGDLIDNDDLLPDLAKKFRKTQPLLRNVKLFAHEKEDPKPDPWFSRRIR